MRPVRVEERRKRTSREDVGRAAHRVRLDVLRLMEEHAPFNRLLGMKGEASSPGTVTMSPCGRTSSATRAAGARTAGSSPRSSTRPGAPRPGRRSGRGVGLHRGPAGRLPRAGAARRAAARRGEAAAQGKPGLPRADERDPGRGARRRGLCRLQHPPEETRGVTRSPCPCSRGPPARRVHRVRRCCTYVGVGINPPTAAATRPTCSGTCTTRASTSTWTARASGRCTSRRAAATSAPTCGARSTSTGRTSAAPSTTAPAR